MEVGVIRCLPSVVVDDLDLFGTGVGPDEADAPLVVDADAVLSLAVTAHLLEPVAGEGAEIVEGLGSVQSCQPLER
jgi:hypothetical protein